MLSEEIKDTGRGSRLPILAVILALASLAFPRIALFEYQGQLIFPHYVVLLLALPLIVAVQPRALKYSLVPLLFILLSSFVNIRDFSAEIALFHGLHFIAIAILSNCPVSIALRAAKLILLIYVASILVAQLMSFLGLQSLIDWLLVQKEGLSNTRVSGFATEPSYAAMIMLILGRFVLVLDPHWMTSRRLALILAAMVGTLSLFALISAILLLALFVAKSGHMRTVVGVLIGGIALLLVVSLTDFFANRLGSLDLSAGAMGLGSGTIRLLPYIYLGEILPDDPLPLLWGGGAGQLEPQFFYALGMYHTNNDALPTHMASAIYDYGLPMILWMFLSWNKASNTMDKFLYFMAFIVIFMNTGIGTYLFIIFGTFALIEKRWREREVRLPRYSGVTPNPVDLAEPIYSGRIR